MQATTGDRKKPQGNFKVYWKLRVNKLNADCGTLQLVLRVFLTGLYLDIMSKRNNVMLNYMSVLLADIGKIHFPAAAASGKVFLAMALA